MVAALHLQETLTTKDGLADNYVNVIFEDSKGNLWFGTTHGVSRYDGVTFQNFTTEDGLAANSVEAIFEDSQGNLWFGMSGWWGPVHGGGVSCYDGKTLKTFRTKDGLACDNDEVVDIFEDRDGNLWFATFGGGVSRYDGHIFFNIKKGLVKDISWMGRGSIDLKFQKDFERGKLSEELQKVLKEHSIPSDGQHIVSITKEEDGWLLTDSWRHIYTVKKVDGELKIYNHTEEGMQGMVYAIAQDTSGNLWFGCSGGITCYDGRTLRNFTAKDGLVSGDIGDLLFDKQGNLWIARGDGEGGGLSRYDGVTFTNFPNSEGLPGNIVHSITQGRKGKLWFGTNDGVSVYDGETFHSHDIKDAFLLRIDFDPQLQADLDNGRIPFGLIQAFEGNNIRLGFSPPDAADVSVQQAGAKWTFNHAVRYVVEKKGNQLEVYRKGVKAILEDRHGTLWFATPGGGVKVGIPTH